MLLATALLALGAAVHRPQLQAAAVGDSTKPPIADTPLDVLKTTVQSFCTIGGIGFGVTAFQEAQKMANVGGRARSQVPYFVITRALAQGGRWGRVSAGFAGGRALGQALRGVDDSTCAMMGSIFGGIAAAPTLQAIPSSVATFAAFGYFIESFTPNAGGSSPKRKLADEVARRDRLRKQLAECDKKIGALQAA
eukprot:6361403-Prymnesium_polylepis.1